MSINMCNVRTNINVLIGYKLYFMEVTSMLYRGYIEVMKVI